MTNDCLNETQVAESMVKPFSEILRRVSRDECSFDEAVRIVRFTPRHLLNSFFVQIQHRVVQIFRMSENSSPMADQVQMTFVRCKLEFQVGQILIASAKTRMKKSSQAKTRDAPEIFLFTHLEDVVNRI